MNQFHTLLWFVVNSVGFLRIVPSPSEPWKVCVLYLPLSGEHTEFTYAVEHVMAMGLFQASNVAQRAANVCVEFFCGMTDKQIDPMQHGQAPQQWLAARRPLRTGDGFRHDRLYIFWMHTDDIFSACLTPEVLVVLLEI